MITESALSTVIKGKIINSHVTDSMITGSALSTVIKGKMINSQVTDSMITGSALSTVMTIIIRRGKRQIICLP